MGFFQELKRRDVRLLHGERSRCWRRCIEQGSKLRIIERLGDVIVKAGSASQLFIILRRACGHCDRLDSGPQNFGFAASTSRIFTTLTAAVHTRGGFAFRAGGCVSMAVFAPRIVAGLALFNFYANTKMRALRWRIPTSSLS